MIEQPFDHFLPNASTPVVFLDRDCYDRYRFIDVASDAIVVRVKSIPGCPGRYCIDERDYRSVSFSFTPVNKGIIHT